MAMDQELQKLIPTKVSQYYPFSQQKIKSENNNNPHFGKDIGNQKETMSAVDFRSSTSSATESIYDKINQTNWRFIL
jgi:hypothetical protein